MKSEVLLKCSNLLGGLETIDLGHVEVHEDQFVAFAVFLIHAHTFLATRGDIYCLSL
jgi:hypothetical protein